MLTILVFLIWKRKFVPQKWYLDSEYIKKAEKNKNIISTNHEYHTDFYTSIDRDLWINLLRHTLRGNLTQSAHIMQMINYHCMIGRTTLQSYGGLLLK